MPYDVPVSSVTTSQLRSATSRCTDTIFDRGSQQQPTFKGILVATASQLACTAERKVSKVE